MMKIRNRCQSPVRRMAWAANEAEDRMTQFVAMIAKPVRTGHEQSG